LLIFENGAEDTAQRIEASVRVAIVFLATVMIKARVKRRIHQEILSPVHWEH
jgi:hypothetical protein